MSFKGPGGTYTMAIAEGELGREESTLLVQRMARGDVSAAREVYMAHRDPLLRFVARRVQGSIEDAEEITNDTFLSALDLGETYDGSCSPLTWLCSLASHRIVDFRRKAEAAKRIPEGMTVKMNDKTSAALRSIHDPSISVDELVEQLDRVRIVQALLDSLSHEQREAVTMRYVEGFSLAEIARIMHRSEKAVERLLERAKEKPRREVLRWLGDESFRMICLGVLTL